jgi:hypothetical protein
MAIEFIEAVWQISPYKAEKLLVQLACADWSNADGEFWPTYSEIAKKARVSKPGAIGIIEQLLADGEFVLVEKGGGRGNVNRYKFGEDYMETVTTVRQTWAKIRERKGKRALPNVPQERVNEGDPFPGERVNQNDEKGKPELLHIRKNRHEPEEREREAADSLSELLCELHGIGDKAGWQLKDKFQSLAIVLAGLDATLAGEAIQVLRDGQAKIDDLDFAVFRYEHILWLQIAVDNPFGVSVGHGRSDLSAVVDGFLQIPVHTIRQGLPVNQLHDEIPTSQDIQTHTEDIDEP